MNDCVLIENESGVVYRASTLGRQAWLDYYAREWQLLPDGRWEAQDWCRSYAREIGRWSGSADLYTAVKRAQASSFRNFRSEE